MSINNKTSARQVAKEAGFADKLFLCREHMAMRLESIWRILLQAVSANKNLTDWFSAWNSYTAPANAIGFIRSVLSTEKLFSDFSKSVWSLTEHKKFNIKKLIIIETKANYIRRSSLYQDYYYNY